jgi:hypothetical protein
MRQPLCWCSVRNGGAETRNTWEGAMMDFATWLSIGFNVVLAGVLLGSKKWIEVNVEKRIQHKFDEKLAATESKLRAREAEISALREMVLSGTAQRRAVVDKRRIEAVERLWIALTRLAPLAIVSNYMVHIDFEHASKRTPHEPNLRKFFDIIANKNLVTTLDKEQPAIHEQPFLSPLAWAYYSAYSAIVIGAYMQARLLAEGVEEPSKLLKKEPLRELLKVALPDQAEFIEGQDPAFFHFLLDELKDRLLAELKKMLDGEDSDAAAFVQARRITEKVREVEAQIADDKMESVKIAAATTTSAAAPSARES